MFFRMASYDSRSGAEVWSTMSGQNFELVKTLGADHVINYQNEKFEERVKNLDVVFDTLRETLWTNRFLSLGLTGGRLHRRIAGFPHC